MTRDVTEPAEETVRIFEGGPGELFDALGRLAYRGRGRWTRMDMPDGLQMAARIREAEFRKEFVFSRPGMAPAAVEVELERIVPTFFRPLWSRWYDGEYLRVKQLWRHEL